VVLKRFFGSDEQVAGVDEDYLPFAFAPLFYTQGCIALATSVAGGTSIWRESGGHFENQIFVNKY